MKSNCESAPVLVKEAAENIQFADRFFATFLEMPWWKPCGRLQCWTFLLIFVVSLSLSLKTVKLIPFCRHNLWRTLWSHQLACAVFDAFTVLTFSLRTFANEAIVKGQGFVWTELTFCICERNPWCCGLLRPHWLTTTRSRQRWRTPWGLN